MPTADGFATEADRVDPGPTPSDLLQIEGDSDELPPTMKWRPTDAELAAMRRLVAEANRPTTPEGT